MIAQLIAGSSGTGGGSGPGTGGGGAGCSDLPSRTIGDHLRHVLRESRPVLPTLFDQARAGALRKPTPNIVGRERETDWPDATQQPSREEHLEIVYPNQDGAKHGSSRRSAFDYYDFVESVSPQLAIAN
jgi:hypothetical protein